MESLRSASRGPPDTPWSSAPICSPAGKFTPLQSDRLSGIRRRGTGRSGDRNRSPRERPCPTGRRRIEAMSARGARCVGCRTRCPSRATTELHLAFGDDAFGRQRKQAMHRHLLQACNAKVSSRMRRCVARASHFYRAKFIAQFFVHRRKIILQIPAMMPGLF
jgi:hypothetical protein